MPTTTDRSIERVSGSFMPEPRPTPMPALSVSLGLWQDRPAEEALVTASAADRIGFHELWIGEMATYDAFALAATVAERTTGIPLAIGPLAVAVRDPAMIAMGAATVAQFARRPVRVAIGSSSPMVVSRWHGRPWGRSAQALQESALALNQLLAGERGEVDGEVISTHGYHLRAPAPGAELTIAAFGKQSIAVAALHAHRMVLNLVTPQSAARLTSCVEELARKAGRPRPLVALWAVAAIDPLPAAMIQMRRGLVPYLAAPGYAAMFEEAGFGDLVSLARTRPHPKILFDAVPDALVDAVGLIGDEKTVASRLVALGSAGIDEVALVPPSTDDDPGGTRTLELLARLALLAGVDRDEQVRP